MNIATNEASWEIRPTKIYVFLLFFFSIILASSQVFKEISLTYL